MMKQHLISSSVLEKVINREKKTNSVFTIKSKKTSKDFTYKITRTEFKGNWHTHIRVETQYLSFKYLGTYFMGSIQKQGEKITSPSATAISWVLKKLEEGKTNILDSQIEFMHMGKCVVCGKALTDSDSIERGLGPVCAGS